MVEDEFVYDLKKIRDELRAAGKHKAFVQHLDKAALIQSCRTDLAQARDAIAVLTDLTQEDDHVTPAVRVQQQSLLYTALVLYARATIGSTKHNPKRKKRTVPRGSVQIQDYLDEELKALHQQLIDLRNEAIAHVYLGDSMADWHQQYMFLSETPDGLFQSAAMTRSHTFNKDAFSILQKMIPVAYSIMQERFNKFLNEATRMYNANPFPLTPYRIALSDLIGSKEAAAKATASRWEQTTSFHV